MKEKDDPYKIAKDFANKNDLKTEAIDIIASQIYIIQIENNQRNNNNKKFSFSRASKDLPINGVGTWSPEFALSKIERKLVEASQGSFSEPKKRNLDEVAYKEAFIQVPKSQVIRKVVFKSSDNPRE